MKFIKREKNEENGAISTAYDCADMDPSDSVRCTFCCSYSEINYDLDLQSFSDIYLNCPVNFACSEIYRLRSVMSRVDFLAIVEPVKE